MFERYTERARRAIYFARDEALRRRSETIETSDLLLGMSREKHQPDCPFSLLYDRRAEFRELCGFPPLSDEKPHPKDIALTNPSKMVLAYAAQEADLDKRFKATGHMNAAFPLADATTLMLAASVWGPLPSARRP